MDLKDIKDLILAIDKTSIEKVEIEKNDIKINIYKGSSTSNRVKTDNKDSMVIYEKDDEYSENPDRQEVIENEEDFSVVKSPIVGIYYSSSSPSSESFVKPGQRVKKGDILCIVEAMKIMNEIEAEIDGEVVEIYAQDEDIIQYNQALLKLRRI